MGDVYNPFETEDRLNTINRGCSIYNVDGISIPNSAWTTLSWSNTDYDTDDFHSGSSPEIVIPENLKGRYLFQCLIRYIGNSTGRRQARLANHLNDIIATECLSSVGNSESCILISKIIQVPYNDSFRFNIETFQNSGANLNTDSGFENSFYQILKVG